jgi:hypothetical protein
MVIFACIERGGFISYEIIPVADQTKIPLSNGFGGLACCIPGKTSGCYRERCHRQPDVIKAAIEPSTRKVGVMYLVQATIVGRHLDGENAQLSIVKCLQFVSRS